MSVISLPQARSPIGYATVNGERIPVEIDTEWMLTFTRLLDRSGGTSGTTSFNEYITQFFDTPPSDSALQDTVRAVDDLRHELATARAELQSMRGLIDDQAVQLAQMRPANDLRSLGDPLESFVPADDLRSRIEQIEGRLL